MAGSPRQATALYQVLLLCQQSQYQHKYCQNQCQNCQCQCKYCQCQCHNCQCAYSPSGAWDSSGRSSSWLKPHPTSPALAARIQALGPRKPVAWLVSNCHTDSRRELYVKELQKHVPVDIFGGCGRPLDCTLGRDECFVEIASRYKFYLSFENSLCKDYATEKLFRALAADLVPVVMGGANYSKIVPPRSVINVQDFATPELLGSELKRLLEVNILLLLA